MVSKSGRNRQVLQCLQKKKKNLATIVKFVFDFGSFKMEEEAFDLKLDLKLK